MIEKLKQQINYSQFYGGYFSEHKPLPNDEWLVRCPFHDDKTPSMTVNIKTGMYNCFGCSASGDFINFHMKMKNLDFKSALNDLCKSIGVKDIKIEYKIKETYDYFDAMGEFVSQTIRYEPKKFSQRTKVNGKWVWSLKGVKTVLYNLPIVLNSDKVLLLEGEKDCINADNLGYVATTAPTGS